MALSRAAALQAAEIRQHDWSDAPYRADRAGHDRETDSRSKRTQALEAAETNRIRLNVMWVTAQTFAHDDPNFNVYEYAEACGVDVYTSTGRYNGGIEMGLRWDTDDEGVRWYHRPGTFESDAEPPTE